MRIDSRSVIRESFFFRLGKACAVAALLASSIVLAEIGARFFRELEPVRRVYDPFAWKIPQPGLVDSFVNRDGESVTVRLNELGMRGPSVREPLAPDTQTLVFLGGSTTENYAYRRDDTFPEIAGRELSRRLGRPVRVMNAGMSAATSGTSLARLQHQVLDLEPDLVVVLHAINDLVWGFHPDFRPDGRHLRRPVTADVRPKSYLLHWLRHPRGALRSNPDTSPTSRLERHDFTDFAARRVFERNLRSMVAVASAHHVPILLLTQATMYSEAPEPGDAERFFMTRSLSMTEIENVPDVPTLARGMLAMNATTERVAIEMGSAFFDLAARLPRTQELFYDDCHLTRKGNARAAELLVPALELAVIDSSPERPRPR